MREPARLPEDLPKLPAWVAAQTDWSFHRIGVEVARRGVTVRARRGYHATAPFVVLAGPRGELK